MRKAFPLLIFSVSLALIAARAEQGPWQSIYRSVNRLGVEYRRSLSSEPGATPSLLHASKKKHHSSPSKKQLDDDSAAKGSGTAAPTPKSSAEDADKQKAPESKDNNQGKPEEKQSIPASVVSLRPTDLREFNSQPPKIQEFVRSALALTERNLAYTYGSSDPNSGGMDCSGFIYYVLTNAGYKDAPRQSSDQYLWVRKNSNFHAVLSRNSDTFELKQLRPGDLMFWSGTYQVSRDVPITHVMVYLGTEKKTKKPVMVGASDGRSYDGVRRFGVSVFDFKLPNGTPNKSDPDLIPRFEGYASLPGVGDNQLIVSDQSSPSPTPASPRLKLAEKNKPLSNGD